MKASHQHPHSTSVPVHPHNPWLTTVCVFCAVVIVIAAAVFWIRRCNTKHLHEYHAVTTSSSTTASKEEQQFAELDLSKLEHDEQLQTFQKHLNASKRYRLVADLGKMGWRNGKQWFLIRDTSLDADRLLTLLDLSSDETICSNANTRLNVMELLRSLNHPYILPILDVEFWHLDDGSVAGMLVQPLNHEGSLRNLIYNQRQSSPQGCFVDVCNHWKCTEQRRGRGLPFKQVQSLGRQILEALSYLRMRQFPKYYHLHAGNVIIQNGVARLAALENTLFHLEPKQPALTDVAAFGHLLFEMSVGYELNDISPITIYRDLEPQTVDVIDMILNPSPATTQLSVDALIRHDLFRRVELRELWRHGYEIAPVISSGCSDLLKKMRKSEHSNHASASGVKPMGVVVESTVDVRHRPLVRTSTSDGSLLAEEQDETLTLIVDEHSSRLYR